MTATITAQIGTTDWYLTGIRTSTGTECDHCGRNLKNVYDLVNAATGKPMTVGRGCCKNVTGWTLAAAEAARLLRSATRQAARAAKWNEFTAQHADIAALIVADKATTGRTAQWAHAITAEILDGPDFRWGVWIAQYLAKR